MTAFDRHVLLVMNAWDHGEPEQGPSFDMRYWLPAAQALVARCEVLPFDAAMRDPCALDDVLLDTVEQTRPDLVLFFPHGWGGNHDVAPSTLARLRESTRTMAFFWDDHWRFDDYSSRFGALYDHVLTTDPAAAPRYRALGAHPIVTQYAATPCELPPPIDDDREFRHDVSFVGGAVLFRKWLVEMLGREGIRVEAWGTGFPNGRIGWDEMDRLFRESRINLNISNSRQHDTRFLLASPQNYLLNREMKCAEQIKARHFEIAMAGGCQLSYYGIGLEDFFRIGEEIAIYTSLDDCLLQIRRLLAEPERRIEMARRAWERARAEHTYERRMAEWFRAVWPEPAALPAVAASA